MEREILEELDRSAQSLSLPLFTDEEDVVFDGRIHAYRSADGWALLFELLLYWPVRDGFQGNVAAVGTAWPAPTRVLHRWFPLDPTRPEVDESMEPVGPTCFTVRGVEVPVDWPACRARERQHDTSAELEAFAQIVGEHRDAMWLSRAELDAMVVGMERVLVVGSWTQPHIARGELPSQLECFASIARALESGHPRDFVASKEPNSQDWRLWFRRTQEG